MKTVIALFATLLATATAFAPMQQTVGAYTDDEMLIASWNVRKEGVGLD